MNNSNGKTRRLAGLALFTAIVVVLQLLGSFIKVGPFAVSLVLIPIVVGAAVYGVKAGAWLGFVFGVVVTIAVVTGADAGGYIMFSARPVMTVIVCLMTRQILVWMQTPDNIIDDAYSYIFFVFAGIPATYLYNTLAGIIRALGDSKTPVYFLILSSLLNIALDLLFIVQIGTGTAGAAYATVISQAVSGILCLIYMKKKI